VTTSLEFDPKAAEEGKLVKALVLFAGWRRCSACGAAVLYVDEICGTEGKFVCGACYSYAASTPANDTGEVFH
jgi:formylmethanofuran dehydrogenase subunit E